MNMDEAEQRELGMAYEKTLAAGESITIPDTHESYYIMAPATGASVKGTLINGGSTIGSIACDTHLSTTGLVGGAERVIYGMYPAQCSVVSVGAGSASVTVLIRNKT
jgi:hypothetical protein